MFHKLFLIWYLRNVNMVLEFSAIIEYFQLIFFCIENCNIMFSSRLHRAKQDFFRWIAHLLGWKWPQSLHIFSYLRCLESFEHKRIQKRHLLVRMIGIIVILAIKLATNAAILFCRLPLWLIKCRKTILTRVAMRGKTGKTVLPRFKKVECGGSSFACHKSTVAFLLT